MDQDNKLDSKLRVADNALMQCPKCKALYASNVAFCTTDGTRLEKSETSSATSAVFAEKYEILNEIGSGGMGTVYRVRQIMINKICALKVIPADSLNDVLISRFQREAKMMASLDHVNLGRVFDFGIFQNQPYMVMEYVDGIPLNKQISEGVLQPEEAIDIFGQVLEALSHAHKKNVLHRDVKPSNIMIMLLNPNAQSETARVHRAILLDFGIAKKFDNDEDASVAETSKTQALTRTGEMIGSPLYMSPEQAHGEKMTERSDLYSVGCSLFECLTGTPPFVGKSTVDTLIQHMEKPAPTLKEASLGKDFPAGLERVVHTLLAKNPQDRYQSADEARRALALCLTSGAQALEPSSVKPQHAISPKLMLLGAVSLITTISIVAYLTTQGEHSLRESALPPEGADAIQLDKTAIAVVNGIFTEDEKKQKLKRQKSKEDSGTDEEEDEDDEDPIRYKLEDEKLLSAEKIIGNESVLTLRGRKLSREDVRLIEQNKNIQVLGLVSATYPHEMLGRLSSKVRVLRLSDTNLTDDDLKNVGKNIYLNVLLTNANPVTNKGLRHLTQLKFLWMLDIGNTQIDATGIRELRQLPSLAQLSVKNSISMDDDAAKEISALVGLRSLNMSQTKVSGKGISQLAHIPMLVTLFLVSNRLGAKDLAGLKDCIGLKTLVLTHNKISSDGLKHLLPLKHLVSLDLDRNPITDEGTNHLLKMRQIQHLNISATKLSKQGVMRLSALPNLKEIFVRNVDEIDETFAHDFLTRCKSCDKFVYLRPKGAEYTRKEWVLDEKRKQHEQMETAPSVE